MKRIIATCLIGITSLTTTALILPLLPQDSYAQTSNSQTQMQTLDQLLKTARQQIGQYKYQESIETFQQALAVARKIKYREKEADANLGLGINYYFTGKQQEAKNFYDQALIIFREVGDRLGESATLNNIGLAYHSIGQSDKALEYYRQALPKASLEYYERALPQAGKVKSLEYYQQALPIMQEVESSYSIHIGNTFTNATGNYAREIFISLCGETLTITEEVSDDSSFATTLNNIGAAYHSTGEPQKALVYYLKALSIWQQEVGDRSGFATTINNIGVVCHSRAQFEEALQYFEQALPITQEVDYRSGEATVINNIGRVYNSKGQFEKALEFYKKALPIRQEVGDHLGEATTLNNIGTVYRQTSQFEKALEYYEKALLILQEVGYHSLKATTLNNIGEVYQQIGQFEKAIEFYEKALLILQEVDYRSVKVTVLNSIGAVYRQIGEPEKALEYFQRALGIIPKLDDFSEYATTLNNIGLAYQNIGQPHKALEYFQEVLKRLRPLSIASKEAIIFNNIGLAYHNISQPKKALEYYQQALPILQKVGFRAAEATILSNIGAVYRDSNQPEKAIDYLEKSIKITLQMRGSLKQKNRKTFLEDNKGRAITLLNLLIDQNQPEAAWKWYNLATTFELADYTRLIKAQVKNPEAQELINQWEQNYQRLQAFYSQVEDETSPRPSKIGIFGGNDGTTTQLSQQIRHLQVENNQLAEDITQKYPEVAELFEFKPKDIDKLKANIPLGTVVIQPALLTDIKNVPDSMAIFLVTRDQATLVKKLPIDAEEFDSILTEYRSQLENPNADNYDINQEKLYDYLIRPIETEIVAYSPKRLAIIATGKLRYIPFETLYDNQTDQYLIAKYPIHYLTRISAMRQKQQRATKFMKLLAFGNPQPTKKDLPGAEDEAKTIAENLSGKSLIREKATLRSFENESSEYPLVHLATHACFQKGGCHQEGLKENTILFANNETLNIADAF